MTREKKIDACVRDCADVFYINGCIFSYIYNFTPVFIEKVRSKWRERYGRNEEAGR